MIPNNENNDDKPFQCDKCHKSYKYRPNYSRHKNECGQVPRLQCPLCPYKCKRAEHMRMHLLTKTHADDPRARFLARQRGRFVQNYAASLV